jgi:uncharacterized protein (DUF1501 family)
MKTRRTFLRQGSCAAISSVPILNTLLNLRMAGSLAAATPASNEYRALVCIFLTGGNDSYNMLVPRSNPHYATYAAARSNLALPQSSLLPINPTNLPAGLQLGIHPGMPQVQSTFEAGRAAFIANIGTLLDPIVTPASFSAGSVALPLGLFSHSDQIEQWQTSTPDIRSSRGWAGRAADLLRDLNPNNTVSMNISLNGNNTFQSGQTSYEYSVRTNGATMLNTYSPEFSNGNQISQIRSAALDGQLAIKYNNLLSQGFAASKREAMDAYELFNTAIAPALPSSVIFPEGTLGDSLKMVAKCIAGRNTLGHTRQTFFINVGGWDMHDEVLNAMAALLPSISANMAAFDNAMTAIGMGNQVTQFTASDFGRTLTSNGNGSDHAWGGNQIVMGGALSAGNTGKKVYGQYPDLADNAPQALGRGVMIPTTPVDSYFAELALWLGVPKSQLPLVLPNIGRFYDITSTSNPLGFLV